MLARFFAAKRIPMAVNQAQINISKMEMDQQHQNDIITEFESITNSIDKLLSLYNFNRTCKHWLNGECIFEEKCMFKHQIIKINKKCKYGLDCYYQDTCLYLHPGETIHNHKNQNPNHNHIHNNIGNNNTDHNHSARSHSLIHFF